MPPSAARDPRKIPHPDLGTLVALPGCMARPRRIVRGDTFFITRRCGQRVMRIKPSPETNQVFMYCIALAMWKTGVRVHAACVMSDHHHLVVTDPNGQLPNFLRELHRLTAKAMNALHNESENLWAAKPCSVIRLVTDADVQDKIAYVAANPVAAGLVRDPEQWPGFIVWRETVIRVTRPRFYFRESGACPAELSLVIDAPPTRELHGDWDWQAQVARAIAEKVAAARRAMAEARRRFVGRAAVLATSIFKRAISHEDHFESIPSFASKFKSVRDELGRVERGFRIRYRLALAAWRAGTRDVAFPVGTWWMAKFHGAVTESAHGEVIGPLSSAECSA